MKTFLKLLAASAVFSAAACVSVLPDAPPPAARYLLAPVAYDAPAGETARWSIAIEDPQATRVYDNTRIAVVRAPGRVEYFSGGEWADRSPRLFQAALIRSFENNGRILGVGDRTVLPISDFVLQSDIRAIHADYTGGAPAAKFEVFARLTNARGKVFAAKLFTETEPAADDDVAAVASAFDRALTRAMASIVDWSLAEAETAYAK